VIKLQQFDIKQAYFYGSLLLLDRLMEELGITKVLDEV